VLGFRILWEEATDWRLVERDGVRIMLGHCPDDLPAAEIGSHSCFGYLNVDDVDGLHAELTARGAACTQPVDRPYGMRSGTASTKAQGVMVDIRGCPPQLLRLHQ
jgi:hypothetical protein